MKILFLFTIILFLNFPIVFAEELFITLTDADSDFILDGIWSHSHEWKKSSETIVTQDDLPQFALRYAHNYEKIFLLVDVIHDTSQNSLMDKSVICLQSVNNDKNFPNSIYCFEITLNGKLETLEKNLEFQESNFKKINNFNNSYASSGISNQYDRYSKIPHISYEFEIPIDSIGRSDIYNFYAATFDAETDKILSWPNNPKEPKSFITNHEYWGQMISPDKSIPEFSSPFIVLIILSGIVLLIQVKTKIFRLT